MNVVVTPEQDFLRDKRRRLHITLDDVALALGLKPDAVRPSFSRWERGKGDLPDGITVADYERVLADLEAKQ